ncbi:DUF6480 family protein [Streptomyces prasinosporus]|uniref:DUF6480 family protein n=1 Tax=Streptomyces prasinosporus TaxID=68256 RepID=UPI003CD07448
MAASPRARPRPGRAACPRPAPTRWTATPRAGPRDPMTVILVLVALVAAFFLAYALVLIF